MKSTPRPAIFLYPFFFFSGMCALGYEITWSRMFGAGLGHELPAVLAVVMAFLVGLALGAWGLDGSIAGRSHPARWYAMLELLTGSWALLTPWLISWGNELSYHWLGPAPSDLHYWLLAFGLPFALLLPATIAIGASFPAMEQWLALWREDQRCVGALYAVNTLGALAGVAVTTLHFLPNWGFQTTLLIFGLTNLICGVLVLWIYGSFLPAAAGRVHRGPSGGIANWPSLQRIYATVFFTGLLGVGYEVVGIRALSQVLENTAYTFAAALAVYLLGTSGGAALYQRFGRSVRYESMLSVLLGSLSLAALLGAATLAKASLLYRGARSLLGASSAAGLLSEILVAAAILGLPTLLMGALFSHLIQSGRRPKGGVGRAVALNTLGSALAPLLFGVMVLPKAGLEGSFGIIVLAYLLLLPRTAVRYKLAGAIPTTVLIFLLPSPLTGLDLPLGGRLLDHREGPLASVAVIEYPDGNRTLRADGHFVMGGTAAATAERRQAHIPLLLHPNPRRALFLGVGTGITLGAATAYPGLRADGVELVPDILELMDRFEPENNGPHRSRQVRLYRADARRFVRAVNATYDVIVADVYHPARDGAGSLYTLEHFQAIRRRLAPGGLFCQWLSLFQLDESLLEVIIGTFLEVFPHTNAYLVRPNIDTPVMGLIATLQPRRYPPNWFEERAPTPELLEQLTNVALSDDIHLFGSLLATTQTLRAFSEGAPLNTDDCPVVTFKAPQFVYRTGTNSHGRLLKFIEQDAVRPDEVIHPALDASGFRDKLSRYIAARNLHVQGLLRENLGRVSEAIDLYIRSSATCAEFPSAYARCILLAWQWAETDAQKARSLLKRLDQARPERPVARKLLDALFSSATAPLAGDLEN